MHRFAPRLVAVSSFLISLLLVIASLFVVSLFAGDSSAAPAAGNGNGAATGGGPINVTDCEYLDIFDETTCYTARGDYHFVSTPSGSYQAHYEAHHCFTVYPGTNTSAAPLSQLCGYDHNQFHTSQGEVQVVQDAYGESYTDAAGNSFCYAAQYHEVNGVVQYDRFSTTCKGNAATPVAWGPPRRYGHAATTYISGCVGRRPGVGSEPGFLIPVIGHERGDVSVP